VYTGSRPFVDLGKNHPLHQPLITVDTTLFISVREACHVLGIGRTTLYTLITHGDVVSARHGGRRLVSSASLRAYHDRLVGR